MIETSDIITLGTIIGGAIAGVQALVYLGDRLWKRSSSDDPTDTLIRELIVKLGDSPQPGACGQQHQLIATSLNGHLGAIKELAETMRGMQEAMREQLKNEELRHELMLRELQLIAANQGKIVDKLDRIAERQVA